MTSPPDAAVIDRATPQDLERIENLMQFYNYELSAWYPIDFGPQGLYELRSKAAYWARPGVVPYTLRVAGELAGFAVVDDEVLDPAARFNLGYFFVARRYRGHGLGRRLAQALIERHPGRWEVYHLERNTPAQAFWTQALAQITGAPVPPRREVIDGWPALLYAFAAGPA